MPVEDVFSISGRGTVVTGRIERGIIKVGEEIEIVGIKDTQDHLHRRRNVPQAARPGPGGRQRRYPAARHQARRRRARPGAVQARLHQAAHPLHGEIYVLSKDEGGRHTPFFNNYRPQFYFRTTDVTGSIELPKGKEMVMPGDNVSASPSS
jgi:elongation factor Tu